MEEEETILINDADLMAAYNFSTGEDVEEKPEEPKEFLVQENNKSE